MPILGRSQFGYLVASAVVIVGLFALVARRNGSVARARVALVGGAVAAVVNVGLDAIAHQAGWWTYVEASTPFGPLSYYVLAGVGFALFVLLGDVARHRLGWPGVAAFTAALGLYGTVRDHRFADRFGLMRFRPGPGIALLDAMFEYVIPFGVAFAVTLRIDQARSPRPLGAGREPT